MPSETLLRRVRSRLRELGESSEHHVLEHHAQGGLDHDVQGAPILDAPERVGAVLIRSRLYGELWLILADRLRDELATEEARRPEPRPILYAEDVARLRARPEDATRAALEVARTFPGARVLQ